MGFCVCALYTHEETQRREPLFSSVSMKCYAIVLTILFLNTISGQVLLLRGKK